MKEQHKVTELRIYDIPPEEKEGVLTLIRHFLDERKITYLYIPDSRYISFIELNIDVNYWNDLEFFSECLWTLLNRYVQIELETSYTYIETYVCSEYDYSEWRNKRDARYTEVPTDEIVY